MIGFRGSAIRMNRISPFRVQGLRFEVSGFRVQNLKVQGSGFMVQNSVFSVQCSVFRVEG